MMFVGKWLAHDHGIRIAQFGEDLFLGTAGEKIGIMIGAQDVQVRRSERSRHVLKIDLVSAQAINRHHIW